MINRSWSGFEVNLRHGPHPGVRPLVMVLLIYALLGAIPSENPTVFDDFDA